ncbi:MAG TPA: hypothetical protein VH720_03395 [Candidatus Limnocylindrales bacterium]|jgi:hypothetical protein
MPKFWSETSGALIREVIADAATAAWVFIWTTFGARLYVFISGFAQAGRDLRGGGESIQAAGLDVANSVAGTPVLGGGLAEVATRAFREAGEPFIAVGSSLEELLVTIATLLGLLVVAVALVPWLLKYIPWRARRLAELRSAHTAVRVRPRMVSPAAVNRALAMRAIARMDYEELLEASRDPLGDFARGFYDDLARAELATVGLRLRT